MAFPVMGCLLYYFIEVFPNSRESRSAERAVRAITRALDPDKELRARVADVETCGSVENRMALARECLEHRMYEEAAALYRSCLSGVYENDPNIRYGLAAALLSAGEYSQALELARTLRANHPTYRHADVGLLIARALEGANRLDEALSELKILADTYPGEEGRWRYGALLDRLGRRQDAIAVFRRMVRNAERMPTTYCDAQKEWLAAAREKLSAS
jgi:hypothetical protein